MRTINVKGTATMAITPNMIEIDLSIITIDEDYKIMMEEASKKLDVLTYQLLNLGFKKEDIKTTNFSVTSKYEMNPNNNNSKLFLGYEARQDIVIRFDMNLDLLGEILNAISISISKPELTIRFTVKDEKIYSEELIRKAISDAINNANIIASASNVKLGEIQNIDYNVQNHAFYSRTNISPENLKLYNVRFDFVPQDIIITDSVVITFEIN